MPKDSLNALLLLNRIASLHAKNISPFIDIYGSIEEMITPTALQEIARMNSAGKRLVERIAYEKNEFDVKHELRLIEENNVVIIGFQENTYPNALKEITQPPLALYVKGKSIAGLKPSLSIVGSRNASFYGLEIAEYFAAECTLRGITIVSGFARGIDSAAHAGALKVQGNTVGVLGCGVDVIYPRSNKALYEQIVEKGAFISEFCMGTKPFSYNFPRRNRIIAGLSLGVLVVEASARSGSLITARFALEEGREVYSIPGKINHRGAQGTNRLLKDGARFVESIEDILEDFDIMSSTNDRLAIDGCMLQLSSDEKRVIDQIAAGLRNVDQISAVVDLSSSRTQTILTQLELRKMIKREPGGSFVVKK